MPNSSKFPQVFGPVPQGHRKDCFVALPVCPASSQPSDRSSSSTRQCHWRGGDRSISTKHVKVWSQDRGCYEVSRFLLANMSCPNSKCLYHLDFLQISKTDFRSHRFVVFATKYNLPHPSISPIGHWPNLETSTFVLLHGANTSWKSLQKPRWRDCITSHLTTDINCLQKLPKKLGKKNVPMYHYGNKEGKEIKIMKLRLVSLSCFEQCTYCTLLPWRRYGRTSLA